MTLTETSPGSGVYVYDNNNFFPIDNQLLGNQTQQHNYSFTMSIHAVFTYVQGQNFEVVGDDDIWVFINNKLVIDLGGVHPAESTSINLDSLGLTAGQKYDFDLFFAERKLVDSKLKLQTSIVFEPQCAAADGFKTCRSDIYAGWSVHPSTDSVVSEVSGEWLVPEVDCLAALPPLLEGVRSRAAVWIGMWGKPVVPSGAQFNPAITWLPQIGTVSQCSSGVAHYLAVDQFMHEGAPKPERLFDVSPGQKISAHVRYEGRQTSGELKFTADISSPNGSRQVTWLTDRRRSPFLDNRTVSEDDAVWQGGCIIEKEADGKTEGVFLGIGSFYYGGLAKFPIPIELQSCNVNQLGIDTYTDPDYVFRWDMERDLLSTEKIPLATTGPRNGGGLFSVEWLKWR